MAQTVHTDFLALSQYKAHPHHRMAPYSFCVNGKPYPYPVGVWVASLSPADGRGESFAAGEPLMVEPSLWLASSFMDVERHLNMRGASSVSKPETWVPRLANLEGRATCAKASSEVTPSITRTMQERMLWATWEAEGWSWDEPLKDWVKDGKAWRCTQGVSGAREPAVARGRESKANRLEVINE
jgi:hypothetical protein